MPTTQREFLEKTLIPKFAKLFSKEDKVINIGAGYHPYKEFFDCKYTTADKLDRSCDELFFVEDIPYKDSTFDGVVFIGVYERVDDPMLAMSEIYRVLKPGGYLLFGLPGLKFVWSTNGDRWRMSPGGADYVVKDFTTIERYNIEEGVYFLYILKK
jgi:SAM-dependent methyltransferase